ncbi:hypothetical protein UlMin_027898 [Ulmus minor]
MEDSEFSDSDPSSSSSYFEEEGLGFCRRAMVQLKPLGDGFPLLSATTSSPVNSIRLQPRRLYTIGRSFRHSSFIFDDRRVSRRHCQILFDPLLRKLYLLDGFRKRVSHFGSKVRTSLNGLFVNGVMVRRGMAMELSVGDEVSLVCANQSSCSSLVRIGFIVQKIAFQERPKPLPEPPLFQMMNFSDSQGTVSNRKGYKRVFASKVNNSNCDDLMARANCLLNQCKNILASNDPISYICSSVVSGHQFQLSSHFSGKCVEQNPIQEVKSAVGMTSRCFNGLPIDQKLEIELANARATGDDSTEKMLLNYVGKDHTPSSDGIANKSTRGSLCEPPEKSFYLNRLGFMNGSSSSDQTDISLKELLYPVESISQMFIATFTSDIMWFLSSCEIPRYLPVTIACHSSKRCWDSSPEQRTSVPYPDFPNLVVVYPMFPEDIAFGKDLKRKGIGCHHPKLFVLQRDSGVRVIITSANLVPSQWNSVTNTVWWQDFPRRSAPNFLSLFTQIQHRQVNRHSESDFCSQLAGFMASMLTDVPSQAHLILELTKYDFGGAMGDLVASVPGIHSYRTPIMPSVNFLQGASASFGLKFLGSVEASAVGLSYLFHNAADSKGSQLKKLASFLQKSCVHADGLSEVVLVRNKNVPADANAVSILVPNPNEFPSEDSVQLGFLPRKVAKWVSPLWDAGFFRFSCYVCHKQALAAALGGSNTKVPLSIHISQGPNFQDIQQMMRPDHVFALCYLIAAIQRCTGLWRLQEVLGQHNWPEHLESDFIYGASSIGSIDPRFLATFSAAAGKRSLQFDSEESDPEWGCWTTSQELKNPSIRIIFPTITRVKQACNGVLPSKRILCFSEKTWERLRTVDILHDAIPHPYNRVGHPMHVKVARRRFQTRADGSSFGWVYCGSHNFSAAAWGRTISNSYAKKGDEPGRTNSPSGLRLHVCNYELGIIFMFPPTEAEDNSACESRKNLDAIILPFVVPAPKYRPRDRPATRRAMWEALSELTEQEKESIVEVDEVSDDDESPEESNFIAEEKEDEKAYAQMLWNQIDSS